MVYKNSFLLLFFLLIFSGCEESFSLKKIPGHYEGFLASQENPSVSVLQSSASAEIKKQSELKFLIQISLMQAEMNITRRIDFLLEVQNETTLRLTTEEFPKPLVLKKTTKTCFSDPKIHQTQLCIEGREIRMVFFPEQKNGKISKFILDQMPARKMPALESPSVFSLKALMKKARTHSFESRVEFEKVVQAKYTAQNAELNLLPHLNINTVLNLFSLNVMTIIRSAGDLVPFFLPSRWARAASLHDESLAENDAYKILQASAMNIVEGLGISLLRTKQVIDCLKENKLSILQIRDEILTSENGSSGYVQVGTSDEINIVLNSIDSLLVTLNESLDEEKRTLSQASGFMNPSAILDVETIETYPVTGPIGGSTEIWRHAALIRSLELVQIDHLIDSARNERNSRLYQWLDPSGDDAGSIGFGLPAYVEIGNSKLREIYDKRLQAESLILKKIDQTLSRSNEVYQSYQLAVNGSNIDERRIARLLLNFRTGIQFEMSELVNAIQDKTKNDVNQIDAKFASLALTSKLEFLTFSGPYALLLRGQH